MQPCRERRLAGSYSGFPFRATNAVPAPADSSSNRSKPSGSSFARRVSGGVQIGVSGPEMCATITVPPGAVTRASSGEERDHVEEHDEIEGAVAVGKRRRVGHLEADAPAQLSGQPARSLLDHSRREVDSEDVRLRKPVGHELRPLARPGAEVERPGGGRLEAPERLGQRQEPIVADDLVPLRRQRLERGTERAPQEAPERRVGDHQPSRDAGEAPRDREGEVVQAATPLSSSSPPASTPNIWAALPLLMATEMYPYASS